MIKKQQPPITSASGIKKQVYSDAKLRFSFSLFDASDKEVCPDVFDDRYTHTLMVRLKDLSSWTVKQFVGQYNKAVRNHEIDWSDTSRPNGFSHLNEQYREAPAWQFSVSSNKHGRVHGVIIDDTFYVIWLDCDHKLYPSSSG